MRLSLLTAISISSLYVLNLPAQETKEKEDYSKWEPAISAFESADKKGLPEPGGVLFVGSSSIRMWDTEAAFPDLKTINRGFGGSTTAEVNFFAGRIVSPYRARIIALYAGDNDISKGRSPDGVAADFTEFVRRAREGNPEVKIVYIAIKPSVARWELWPKMQEANGLIAKACEGDPNLEFADISKVTMGGDGKPDPKYFKDDGLHLNADGYEAWKSVIAPLLQTD